MRGANQERSQRTVTASKIPLHNFSMKLDLTNQPWAIRGVPMDARALANQAAREQGVSVGEWLSTAIVGYASLAEVADKRTEEQENRLLKELAGFGRRMAKLEKVVRAALASRQLAELNLHRQATANHPNQVGGAARQSPSTAHGEGTENAS